MNREAIEAAIQAEMNTFNMQKFPGTLPRWLLDNFEKIIMEMPQIDVPYRGETIKSIIHKEIDELNIFETGLVVNILLNVAPKYLAPNVEKFIVKKVVLEQIVAEYNSITKKEMDRLQRKTMSFAAASNSNGNRIIRN
jgi:hypothetical protein